MSSPATDPSERTVLPGRSDDATTSMRASHLSVFERFGLLFLCAAVILFFALWSKTGSVYLSSANVQTMIGNQVVLAIAAIALIPPLVCNRYDLSVGGIVGITAVACAAAMSKHGWPLVAAAALAIGLGALIGLINGLLITRLQIDSFITTLATATLLGGVILWYTNGLGIVSNLAPNLLSFGTSNTFGIPTVAVTALAVALAIWYLLQHTPFGRYLQAIGVNEEAAHLAGLDVDRLVVRSFVVTGAVAGIAGVVLVARTGGVTPSAGPAYLLPAYAAVFLGAAAIHPGRFNVWGTIVAIVFLALITSGLNLAGAEDFVNSLVNGAALLVGVGVTQQFARRRTGQ
jgi:ribose transport system permease protein